MPPLNNNIIHIVSFVYIYLLCRTKHRILFSFSTSTDFARLCTNVSQKYTVLCLTHELMLLSRKNLKKGPPYSWLCTTIQRSQFSTFPQHNSIVHGVLINFSVLYNSTCTIHPIHSHPRCKVSCTSNPV